MNSWNKNDSGNIVGGGSDIYQSYGVVVSQTGGYFEMQEYHLPAALFVDFSDSLNSLDRNDVQN